MLNAMLMLWALGSLPPAPDPGVAAAAAVARLWNHQRSPAPGPPRAIGAYAAGCLQGAKALAQTGPGYETLRRSRHRYFGHPDLIDFIARLGAAAEAQQLPWVAIGDLSQARGGPTPSGHRSHQSGLDVDVAYAPPAKLRGGHLAPADREHPLLPAVVDLRTNEMTATWNSRIVRLLAIAAGDPAVERIFVHPAVRRALCAGPERHAPWLVRLRPWWGHHDHFHVRLKCPTASPLCQPQEPAPLEPDEGCGATLQWWFNPAAESAHARRNAPQDSPPPPVLPSACSGLVSATPRSPASVKKE
jgi:penicillin-insensitive murein endopeptidase